MLYYSAFSSDIFVEHLSQINFPLYSTKFFEFPQNTQFGSYFFSTIFEPSTYISIGSLVQLV